MKNCREGASRESETFFLFAFRLAPYALRIQGVLKFATILEDTTDEIPT